MKDIESLTDAAEVAYECHAEAADLQDFVGGPPEKVKQVKELRAKMAALAEYLVQCDEDDIRNTLEGAKGFKESLERIRQELVGEEKK